MQILNNKFFNALYSCGASVLQGISTGLGHVWKHLAHSQTPLLISFPSDLGSRSNCSTSNFKKNRYTYKRDNADSIKDLSKDLSKRNHDLKEEKTEQVNKQDGSEEVIIDQKLDSQVEEKLKKFNKMRDDKTIQEFKAIDLDINNLHKIRRCINKLNSEKISNYSFFKNKINSEMSCLLDIFLNSEQETTKESLAYFKIIFSHLINIRNEKDQMRREKMLQTLFDLLVSNCDALAVMGKLTLKRK